MICRNLECQETCQRLADLQSASWPGVWPSVSTPTGTRSQRLREPADRRSAPHLNSCRRRGVPKSVLVRECVEAMLRRKQGRKPPICLDLIGDLVGSQPGPRDASVNRRYLDEAGLADHGHIGGCPR